MVTNLDAEITELLAEGQRDGEITADTSANEMLRYLWDNLDEEHRSSAERTLLRAAILSAVLDMRPNDPINLPWK